MEIALSAASPPPLTARPQPLVGIQYMGVGRWGSVLLRWDTVGTRGCIVGMGVRVDLVIARRTRVQLQRLSLTKRKCCYLYSPAAIKNGGTSISIYCFSVDRGGWYTALDLCF